MQKIAKWIIKEFNKGNVIAFILLLIITPLCSILFPVVFIVEVVILFVKNCKIKKEVEGGFKNEE